MIKKQNLKGRPACKVTFVLPAGIRPKSASVVGDFNNWDPSAHPLRKQRGSNAWRTTVELAPNQSYQFRYYVDGGVGGAEWYNDDAADAYQRNEHGGENSVVRT
ncbi:MAG: isoamylase early set domain-containing protein [Caldilineaceae bacterium]|nr:isoamylase early set domain-containing protein [Caldilineaceae bacterium]